MIADRLFHGVAWLLWFVIAGAVYFGREWLMIILWAVCS